MTSRSRSRPAARSSRTPVSPADFDSLRPSGRRISGWWRNAGGASRPRSRPRRICAAVASSRSRPRIDEVDALAQVVDDHAEPVGPVAVPVADRQVASRGTSPAHGPTSPSIQASEPPPSATREHRARQAASATAARAPRPGHGAVRRRPRRERRPRAVAAVHEPVRPQPRERRRVRPRPLGSRLASGPRSAPEPEPGEVLEHRRVELRPAALPVVVLDPQQDPAADLAGHAPHPDRVGDVTQVQVTRSGPARTGSASPRGSDPPRQRSPARRARVVAVAPRSRASSARVAANSRR